MIIRADGGLKVHCVVCGEMMTNAYVLVAPPAGEDGPEAVCWVVDTGLTVGPVMDLLRRDGRRPERLLLTHGHADHIAGVAEIKAAWPEAVLTAPAGDAAMLADPMANLSGWFGANITAPPPDHAVRPGDELAMGPLTWRVLDLGGHSPGGVGYYCGAAGVAIVGDALFAAGIGRTDIPGASEDQLLANIRRNLLTLPDATRVLPGHGPGTSIGDERRGNPFL